MRVPDQTKQHRAANSREPGGLQYGVEPRSLFAQYCARFVRPSIILKRRTTDDERGTGADPRPHGLTDLHDQALRPDGEAEPQSGKAIKLAERAQHDDRPILAQSDRADRGIEIDKGLIDHHHATSRGGNLRDASQHSVIDNAAIGIIRIDDHDVTNGLRRLLNRSDGGDLMPRQSPRGGVFVVGRRNDSDSAALNEARQPLDQRLCAGRGDNPDIVRNGVSTTRGRKQRGLIGARWQTLPGIVRQWRKRIRIRIDAGRQIEPRLRRAAEPRHRFTEIAAVFHAPLMPRRDATRERFSLVFIGILAAIAAATIAPARAAELPRIASINACTDQLLLALADPDQILGLGPYSRDAARSWSAAAAHRYPRLSGEAEDVLVLKPDVVVAGSFTKRATRELLKEQGEKVVTFDVAHSLDEVKAQIRKMGK